MKNPSQAYIDNETASEKKPVELFHLWSGPNHWRYTSGDVDIDFNGSTWVRAEISRDPVQHSGELEDTTMTLHTTHLKDPVGQYIAQRPFDPVWVEVLRLHRDQAPLEASVIFVGQVGEVAFKGRAASAACVGLTSVLGQAIPRDRWQPGCNNTLYGDRCGVNKLDYDASALLSAISEMGLKLTSTVFGAQADGWYTLGYVIFNGHERMIMKHVGNDIWIRTAIPDLTDTDTVTVYAGCNLSRETCEGKFNNLGSFFGHPHIPVKNPCTW